MRRNTGGMPAWAVLAIKFAAVLAIAVLIVGGGLYAALRQSDEAQQQSGVAQDRSASTYRQGLIRDARARQNRELIVANRRLVNKVRRLVRQNRRTLKRIGRLLVQARIAKPGQGGLRITEAARGATGATGAAGATGATGAAAMISRMRLEAALIPLLPAALAAICGDCRGSAGRDGIDAPVITQDMVNEAVRVVCREIDCARPGPQGPPGEPAPPATCNPAQGYVCQTPSIALPPPDPPTSVP